MLWRFRTCVSRGNLHVVLDQRRVLRPNHYGYLLAQVKCLIERTLKGEKGRDLGWRSVPRLAAKCPFRWPCQGQHSWTRSCLVELLFHSLCKARGGDDIRIAYNGKELPKRVAGCRDRVKEYRLQAGMI